MVRFKQTLLKELGKLKLDGVDFYSQNFTPRPILGKSVSPKFEYESCNGIGINIFNRDTASPLLITTHIIDIVNKIHPTIFRFNADNFIDKLYGSDMLRKVILENKDIDLLFNKWDEDQISFEKIRAPFLLY